MNDDPVVALIEPQTMNGTLDVTIQASDVDDASSNNGYSLNFDGIDDFVSLPDIDLSYGNEISISLWINPNNITSNFTHAIIKSENEVNPEWMLQFTAQGTILEFGTLTTRI